MLFEIEKSHGGVAIVTLRGKLNKASLRGALTQLADRLYDAHCTAIVFDFAMVRGVNMAGLTAMIDMFKSRAPVTLSATSIPASMRQMLEHVGLLDLIPCYETVQDALSSPSLRPLSLLGTRAVVLCAGEGRRAQPMTNTVPKPMFDIVGRPLLDHVLSHLERSGIRDVLLNPGHLAPAIRAHLSASPRWRQSVFCAFEGSDGPTGWHADPIGSASTLKHLQIQHGALDRDVIVMRGDTLTDIDLAAMMSCHRDNKSDATIAVKSKVGGDTNGRYAGVYVFSPHVFDTFPEVRNLDIEADLLPHIRQLGGKVSTFQQPFRSVQITTGQDYAAVQSDALTSKIDGVHPLGVQRRPNQWIHESAQVSRRATLEGPVYIGAGTRVDAGAKIVGPSVIGAHCLVEGRSLIRASVLMENTVVARGALVDHMIASADWAVDHRYADGSNTNFAALDGVHPRDQGQPPLAQAV